MKKAIYSLVTACTILLSGCFDTTQEITINENGSGVLLNTTDMSSMIGMLKQFGGEQAEKMKDMSKDTTVNLGRLADSLKTLSAEEKKLLKDATLGLKINIADEKFVTKINFPFNSFSELATINSMTGKVMAEAMKKQMSESPMAGKGMDEDGPAPKSLDDYFDTKFTNGLLTRTLNKEKHANAEEDEYLKSLKEMAGMGAPMTANYIINLPRPAKKVNGKAVKLSDDKRTVTLNLSIEDFFDNPEKFEYRIEY